MRLRRRIIRSATVAVAVAALVGAALSGCASDSSLPDPTISSSQALETYAGVAAEVTDALAAAFPDVAFTREDDRGPRITDSGDEGCVVVVGPAEARPSLVESAGGWDAVIEVVNPVLTARGFEPIEEAADIDGGWTGIHTTDDDGAQVELIDKSRSELTVRVRVTDDAC